MHLSPTRGQFQAPRWLIGPMSVLLLGIVLLPNLSTPVMAIPDASPGVPTLPVPALRSESDEPPATTLTGVASWYGKVMAGRLTASGERFRPSELTAAHRTLPFGTRVRVIDLATGHSVVVKITDRGTLYPDRVIDLSSGAARKLGILRAGVARVRLELLKPQNSQAACSSCLAKTTTRPFTFPVSNP